MKIPSSNTNAYYIEFVNSFSDVTGIRKTAESKSQNEEKSYLKYSTQSQRSVKVSDNPEKQKTIQDYNITLQQNTPAVKLLKILKSFNETKKIVSTYDEDNVDFEAINELSEKEFSKPSPSEIGFYVVIDEPKTNVSALKIKKASDIWRGRINNTYQLGFIKEPGTLVNMVI